MFTVVCPRLNRRENPLSVDDEAPLFSWKPQSDVPGDIQTAYQVVVTTEDGKVAWDSGKVDSDETINIAYAGEALKPHTRYNWQVTVWNKAGEKAASESAYWRTGYMGEEWTAQWVSPDPEGTKEIAAFVRKDITLKDTPVYAEAAVFCCGWFDFFVNGKKTDDRLLSPTNTNDQYAQCIYDTYDITGQLKAGDNAIGLWIGDGYNMNFCQWGWRYKDNVKCARAEIRVTYADGTAELIVTDGSWVCSNDTPAVYNAIYHGERYDARKERPWCEPGIPLADAKPVTVIEKEPLTMIPAYTPRIRVTGHIQMKSFWRNAAGNLMIDFGQNTAGWLHLHASAPAGHTISMHFAEEIFPETKELDPFTNNAAEALDEYTFKGEGVEDWEPRFTYHGFRYVEITGFEGDPAPDTFTVCVVNTDNTYVGEFTTDDKDVNQLYNNIRWGFRSNAYTYPTDCPMRAERTPCFHDVVVYADTASYIWDVDDFWRSFVLNYRKMGGGVPTWEGAAITIGWYLYTWYGNKRMLETCYDLYMRLMHNFEERWPNHLTNVDTGFGDWCAVNPVADGGYLNAFSYRQVTSTALWAFVSSEMVKIAKVLGKTEDLPWLETQFRETTRMYNEHLFDEENQRYGDGEQTAEVLPLFFGMVPEERKARSLQNIVDGIKRKDTHVDTGIYGTKYLPMVLADNGYLDLAMDALFNPTFPSYGYEFAMGATTIWEQWWYRGGMASHNHGMFGGGATFLFTHLLGLHKTEDACKTMEIKPVLSRRIHKLSGSVDTVRGVYAVSYTRDEKTADFTVTVPFGCTATVILPDGATHVVNAGTHTFTSAVVLSKN